MKKATKDLAPRAASAPIAYGRKLNNRARAVVHDALERVITGDMRDMKGPDGRNFADQLAYELIASPLASMMRIDAATPSDEAEESAAPQGQTNIQALYLMAVQQANKPEPIKTIEGTVGVQPAASDW